MTLEELDQALERTGLDLTNPPDMEARNKVLALHGYNILKSKKSQCDRCWYRENGRCDSTCYWYQLPDDPVEVSKQYLSRPNNVKIFPFLCLYMIPVYEEVTGNRDTMKILAENFKKRWKKEFGDKVSTSLTQTYIQK